MAKKKRIDPETRARWAEEERELARHVQRLQEELMKKREREERRRARLRRLSFGLLGR
jgi:hypothetical protein